MRPTVDEIIARHAAFAAEYYRKPSGAPTREADNLRHAAAALSAVAGDLNAATLTPANFREAQRFMIALGLTRSTINARMLRIRRMIRWAFTEQLLGADVVAAASAIPPLRRGRSAAREKPPVTSVPEEHVEATCRRLSPQLVAMVQLLLHSGMRVGELLAMTADAIDIQADPWRYTPTEHKTAHHGIVRVIVLGPRARATLAPWLDPGEPWLFPTVAAARPIWRSRTGAPITANNFRRRVQRAAAAAGVPTWTPLQLRHTAATRVRRHLGLETARAVLGHTIATTTEIYAERDVQLAVDAMQLLG